MLAATSEVRGAIARAMVAQDARWLIDAWRLSSKNDGLSGIFGLAFLGHIARVTFEGFKIVASTDPNLGDLALAQELKGEHGEAIERARHATKLLDDNKKAVADLQSEMGLMYALHRRKFRDHLPWGTRWLTFDLGLLTLDDRVLVASIPTDLRFGIGPAMHSDEGKEAIIAMTTQMGATIGALSDLDGVSTSTDEPRGSLSSLARATWEDTWSRHELWRRFEAKLSNESKLLLLLIEGDINLAAYAIPSTAIGHEDPVFRAQLVTAKHTIGSIHKVLASSRESSSTATLKVRALLAEPDIAMFIDNKYLRRIRNHSFHYEVHSSVQMIDESRPMFGLVEQIWPEKTYEDVNANVKRALDRTSDMLHSWTSR